MKIKLNWGMGVVIAFVLFIGFIMSFVIRMSTNKAYEHDLVVEEYYKQETHFQDQLDATKNLNQLQDKVQVTKTDTAVQIQFPASLAMDEATGSVMFYRPDNKKLDVNLPLTIEAHQMLIPKHALVQGNYRIQMEWTIGDQVYFYDKPFRL